MIIATLRLLLLFLLLFFLMIFFSTFLLSRSKEWYSERYQHLIGKRLKCYSLPIIFSLQYTIFMMLFLSINDFFSFASASWELFNKYFCFLSPRSAFLTHLSTGASIATMTAIFLLSSFLFSTELQWCDNECSWGNSNIIRYLIT